MLFLFDYFGLDGPSAEWDYLVRNISLTLIVELVQEMTFPISYNIKIRNSIFWKTYKNDMDFGFKNRNSKTLKEFCLDVFSLKVKIEKNYRSFLRS